VHWRNPGPLTAPWRLNSAKFFSAYIQRETVGEDGSSPTTFHSLLQRISPIFLRGEGQSELVDHTDADILKIGHLLEYPESFL
jgi:hypothetical protein